MTQTSHPQRAIASVERPGSGLQLHGQDYVTSARMEHDCQVERLRFFGRDSCARWVASRAGSGRTVALLGRQAVDRSLRPSC